MKKNNYIELDYLILASIICSDETEEDIINMVIRFVYLRNSDIFTDPLFIQNPSPKAKKG